MEKNGKVITCERQINASPKQIFNAFTNATKLRHWLCDVASCDPKSNGRIYLAWDNGYFAAGYFTEILTNQKISFSWSGKDEPAQTIVTIDIRGDNEKSTVTLNHAGIRDSGDWEKHSKEIEKGWQIGLENLASILETGIDLRISRRPLLGIYPEPYTRKKDDDPFPMPFGIRVLDLVEGLLAGKCGLQAGDILVSLENQPISSYSSLLETIMHFRAGDNVEVSFYRGSQKFNRTITLSAMTLPQVPESPQQLAEVLSKNQNKYCDEMMSLLRAISDKEASFKPGENEWSIKEIIAHLVHSERDQQLWIQNTVQSTEPQYDNDPDNLMARVQATVKLYPTLPQLLELLRASLKETVTLIAHLPEDLIKNKDVFWRLTYVCTEYGIHLRSHAEQIENNLKLARVSL